MKVEVATSPRRPVSSKGSPLPYPSNITDGLRKIHIALSVATNPVSCLV